MLMTVMRKSGLSSTVVTMGTADRVDYHLDQWAIWKRGGWTAHMRSGGSGTPDYTGSTHVEDMEEQMDARCARIMDTLIDDMAVLSPAQACAVHHHYLNAVYRFSDRYPLGRALREAKVWLGKGLVRKGIY
jgi:hypothetical protein